MKISAYIPCYNNEQTIAQSIKGILNQTTSVDEFFVIDDGSTDESVQICNNLGVKVYQSSRNLGRGATRAFAMENAAHEMVLCCDATLALEKDFIKKALIHFSDEEVGAVFGKVKLKAKLNAVDRWRSIYLFKEKEPCHLLHNISLLTGGALLKKDVVLKIGNFNQHMRQAEDHDLGIRLNNSGIDTISDTNIEIWSLESDGLFKTMERYWRWNHSRTFSFKEYLKSIMFSFKFMFKDDFKDGDLSRSCISLLYPHFVLVYQVYYLLKNEP